MTRIHTIPSSVAHAVRHALVRLRADRDYLRELIRVYGPERGLDEYQSLRNAVRLDSCRKTVRDVATLGRVHGLTFRQIAGLSGWTNAETLS